MNTFISKILLSDNLKFLFGQNLALQIYIFLEFGLNTNKPKNYNILFLTFSDRLIPWWLLL